MAINQSVSLDSNGNQKTEIVDSSNVAVSVKAASTAAVAADTALVVSVSPNTVANVQIGTTSGLAQSTPIAATVAGYGTLRTSPEANSIFYDPFDSALDTTDKWNTPVTSGGGSVTQGTGGLTTATGTLASSYGYLTSKPTFVGTVPGYAQIGYANKFEATTFISGAFRFFGVGTNPAIPTTAAPLTDAVGWEITTAGRFCAVVYASGVRTLIADLTTSGAAKTDGAYHRYVMFMRTDKTFWYIDSLDVPVATSNFQFPTIQQLPLLMLSVNGASVQAIAPSIISTGIGIGDTGHTSVSVSDGASPWRRLTVKAPSTAAVAADLAVVVTMSPNNTTTVQGPSGSPGTPSGGILTIQGVTGATPVPTTSKTALTPSAPATASIGVASTTVIAANASRKGLVIQNTSSLATVSLHLNNGSAVLSSGITLYPHDIWYMDEYSFTVAQVNAISSIAATPVSIQEFS